MLRPPEYLETERLCLRPPTLADAEEIFRSYAQDREVTRYLVWRPHAEVEETCAFVRRCLACWEKGNAFPWVVTRKPGGELIGMLELRVEGWRADMGYALARAHWGHGYASEMVKAAAAWALAQPEIYRVWAVCDVENGASARVLEKAGLQREGTLRRYILHPNLGPEPRDCYCYALVK